MGVIYKITNPNGRLYVGKAKNYRKRMLDYKYRLTGDSRIIVNSIKKYGLDAHKFEIIEDDIPEDKLNEREIFWIKELNTFREINDMGMNMTVGGDGQSIKWMHDIERRKKASIYFTENPPFKGKKHTEENKKLLSKLAKERNLKDGRRIPKWGAEKGRLKVIRSVLCYDKYGNFLREFDSLENAAKFAGCNHSCICDSCKLRKTGVRGKYVFRYKEPNFPLKIEVGELKQQNIKRPVLYLNKNNQIIQEYPSALEASIDLKVPKTTINRAALREIIRPIREGHIFLYKDLYDKLVLNKMVAN